MQAIAEIRDSRTPLPDMVHDHLMLLTTPGAAWKYIVMWDQIPDHHDTAFQIAQSLGNGCQVQEIMIGERSFFLVTEMLHYHRSIVH